MNSPASYVAAGVHDARVLGGEGDATFFLHRERVYVRPHHDPLARLRTNEPGDRTTRRWTRAEFESEIEESSGDDVGRAVLLEGKFRLGVEVVAKLDGGGARFIEQRG